MVSGANFTWTTIFGLTHLLGVRLWSSASSPAWLLRPEVNLVTRSADREAPPQLPCRCTESSSNGGDRFSLRCLESTCLIGPKLLYVGDILGENLRSLAARGFHLSLGERHSVKCGHVGSPPGQCSWRDYTHGSSCRAAPFAEPGLLPVASLGSLRGAVRGRYRALTNRPRPTALDSPAPNPLLSAAPA